jgi:hypothetical protein
MVIHLAAAFRSSVRVNQEECCSQPHLRQKWLGGGSWMRLCCWMRLTSENNEIYAI